MSWWHVAREEQQRDWPWAWLILTLKCIRFASQTTPDIFISKYYTTKILPYLANQGHVDQLRVTRSLILKLEKLFQKYFDQRFFIQIHFLQFPNKDGFICRHINAIFTAFKFSKKSEDCCNIIEGFKGIGYNKSTSQEITLLRDIALETGTWPNILFDTWDVTRWHVSFTIFHRNCFGSGVHSQSSPWNVVRIRPTFPK